VPSPLSRRTCDHLASSAPVKRCSPLRFGSSAFLLGIRRCHLYGDRAVIGLGGESESRPSPLGTGVAGLLDTGADSGRWRLGLVPPLSRLRSRRDFLPGMHPTWSPILS
jgi:hypothetical protein